MNALPSAPRLVRAYGLQLYWSARHASHLLVLGNDQVALNPLAADILESCDGRRAVDELVGQLTGMQDSPLAEDIRAFVRSALRYGWLHEVSRFSPQDDASEPVPAGGRSPHRRP